MFACMVYCNKKSIQSGLTPVYTVNGYTDPDYWGPIPTSENGDYAAWKNATCDWAAVGYRLPTEAEWEYAARSGSINPDYLYSGGFDLDHLGWFSDNGVMETHPVGQKQGNGLSIYDMSGNVREWCWDWYNEDYYSLSPTNNPTGPVDGSDTTFRVTRGGGFLDDALHCAVSRREYSSIMAGQLYLGFRIVRGH
jgi:formylglycine-generating enzyme required for sulfatase activity